MFNAVSGSMVAVRSNCGCGWVKLRECGELYGKRCSLQELCKANNSVWSYSMVLESK